MSDDVFDKFNAIATPQQLFTLFNVDSEQMREIANHRQWLSSIRHERPSPDVHFKVGVYMQISPERCDDFASGGVSISLPAVWLFRMNGAFGS